MGDLRVEVLVSTWSDYHFVLEVLRDRSARGLFMAVNILTT